MDFKSLDLHHKRLILLNAKIVSNFLMLLAELLDESDYIEVSSLMAELNQEVISLRDADIEHLIADIEDAIAKKDLVIVVKVRDDRN